MSDVTINWDSTSKRKISIWRDSPNKSKSAKRVKLGTPSSYRSDYPHHEVSKPSQWASKTWSEQAHEIAKRGADLSGDDPLDAEFEAMFVMIHYEYKDAYWNKLAKQMFAAHEATFFLDVATSMMRVRDQMYAEAKKDDWVPRWLIHEKMFVMLPQARRQIAGLKQPEYDTTIAHADALWEDETIGFGGRIALAYLFPQRAEWGEAVVAQWPANQTDEAKEVGDYPRTLAMLFATGASVESKKSLGDKLFATQQGGSPYVHMGKGEWNSMYDVLDVHGADGLELLISLYMQPWSSHPTELAKAMSLVESVDVSKAFAAKLWRWQNYWRSNKEYVVEMTYMHDHAEQSLAALVDELPKATSNADRLEEMIADLRSQLAGAAHEAEHADLYVSRDDLPRGLAAPPWRDKSIKRKRRKKYDASAFADLKTLPFEQTFDLGEDGGEAYDAQARESRGDQTDEQVLDGIFEEIEGSYYWYWYIRYRLGQLTRDGLEAFLERIPANKLGQLEPSTIRYKIVNPLGQRAEGALRTYMLHATNSAAMLDVMEGSGSPELVKHVAYGLGRVSMRRKAAAWVKKHAEATAIGAIPGLLQSEHAKERNGYIEALCLANAEDPECVARVIAEYGEEVAAALPDLDVYLQCPTRMPKMPHFWTPDLLPSIRLEADPSKLLPQEVYEDIGLMFKFSQAGAPYIGLVELGEIADETSLAEFCWGLFEAWVEAGAPNKESWVIQSVAMFGGSQMADRLPLYIDRWYDSQYNKRAEKIMYSLENDENPYVIETFWRLIQGGFNWALYRARDHVERITGITGGIETIADEKAPTFGMDSTRQLELVAGSNLEVWLDADLEPHLRTKDRSDFELDETTQLRWERLQALCARQNRFQAIRFERAMKVQRRWEVPHWTDSVHDHPLLGLIAQRIIWGAYDASGDLVLTWRIDEEGEFVDADDEPIEIPQGVHVGIAHPIEIEAEQLKAWSQVLLDYEIVQPFEQVTKPIVRVTGEQVLEKLGQLNGRETVLGAIQHLCHVNDWTDRHNRNRDNDVNTIFKHLQNRAGERLFDVGLSFYPGFPSGYSASNIPEMTKATKLSGYTTSTRKKVDPWDQVDPVELAELYYEVDYLITQAVPEE